MKLPLILALLLSALSPAATAFADSAPADDGASLPRAVAFAREAVRFQAARLGLDLDAAPTFDVRHDGPSEAAFALLARHDATPTEEQAAQLRALDALPQAQREAVWATLDAYLGFEDASRAMYAAGAEAPDFALGFAARDRLLDAAILLEEAFPPRTASAAGCAITVWPALTLDLQGCDDVHVGHVALSIDVGGADTYRNNAGGNDYGWGYPWCDILWLSPASAFFDLAGNDQYLGESPCGGRNGGGALGQGFLLDAAGDDLYAPVDGSGGVNGGGIFAGSGFLLDAGGSDVFRADSDGANGGGYFGGVGLLVSVDGDDLYEAARYGVNGGAHTGGAGLLFDAFGHDRYIASDNGVNGGAYQGVGALVDIAGNDVYYACCVSANGAGNLGVGLLLDAGGWDSYREWPDGPKPDETKVKGTGAQVDLLLPITYPAVYDHGDGTCTIYNDPNRNGQVDSSEYIIRVPCRANPAYAQEADGRCYVYNDQDGNGQRDVYDISWETSCPPEPGAVPVQVPGLNLTQAVPAQSTPGAPPTTLTTPPVGTPATCPVPGCTEPTTVPAVSTLPIPQVCIPPVLCVGPVPSQPVTPPVTLPAACALAPLCLPPTTLLGSQTVDVPGVPSVPLTQPITVSVTSAGFTGAVDPAPPEPMTLGPIALQVGPVPVTLCPDGCVLPAGAAATLSGSVTVTVVVEGQTFTQTVPIAV